MIILKRLAMRTLVLPTDVYHDYSIVQRTAGRYYVIVGRKRKGDKIKVAGIGRGITRGDYILLQETQGGEVKRYIVTRIRYQSSPSEQWHATLLYTPPKDEKDTTVIMDELIKVHYGGSTWSRQCAAAEAIHESLLRITGATPIDGIDAKAKQGNDGQVSMSKIRKLAVMLEGKGYDVSVCDSCEETYPEEWIMPDGVCPLCGLHHTKEDS